MNVANNNKVRLLCSSCVWCYCDFADSYRGFLTALHDFAIGSAVIWRLLSDRHFPSVF